MKPSFYIYLSRAVIFIIFLISCFSCGEKPNRNQTVKYPSSNSELLSGETKLGKVIYYIENSASVFGYVNSGASEYVGVISELSEKISFIESDVKREFYFVNGIGDLSINKIGDNPKDLKSVLNQNGFRRGDTRHSDLNSMFNLALSKAQNDTISILVSDGIYDISAEHSPFNALETEGKGTRTEFVKRLGTGDLETIIIKAKSDFSGSYYCSSNHRVYHLNDQKRPFYIWIFGDAKLLDQHFTSDYLNSSILRGYSNSARFFKVGENKVSYQLLSGSEKGSFKPGRGKGNENTLENAETDRNTREFQFKFAVDFSGLALPENYLLNKSNYECNLSYSVLRIEKIKEEIPGLDFSATHVITLSAGGSPYGELDIVLKSQTPGWIKATSTNSEEDIEHGKVEDTTFGFRYLMDGITSAYEHANNGEHVADFTFRVNK